MKARQAPRRTGRDAPSRRQRASISPCPSDAPPSCAKSRDEQELRDAGGQPRLPLAAARVWSELLHRRGEKWDKNWE
jgi:hypothetical protein